MITITLPASHFMDGEEVRKPTGTMKLVVRREVIIYGEQNKNVTADPGVVFLVSPNGNINCVGDGKMLSADFDTPEDAIEFLQSIGECNEC